MLTWLPRPRSRRVLVALVAIFGLVPLTSTAQDRLKTMPGYEQYQKMSGKANGSVKMGTLNVTWKDGGKAFDYQHDGKSYHFDIAAGKAVATGEAKGGDPGAGGGRGARGGKGGKGGGGGGGGRGGKGGQQKGDQKADQKGDQKADQQKADQGKGGRGGVERGRQVASVLSPDGKFRAFYRDHNLWLSDDRAILEARVTTDGNAKERIKYGTGSWVYGEELRQTTAIWWSRDSKKVAFYRFDEGKVPDYFLTLNQVGQHNRLDIEAYPKAGDPNPIVDLLVYDLESKKTVKVDVRDGKPFANDVVGHYVYNVRWSPDGKEIFFNRTNRRQNSLDFTAADPTTGKCRVIIHEEWPASWVNNSPQMRYLNDSNRFIWNSERNGWNNFYLYDLSGKLIAPLTSHTTFEAGNIIRVDENAGLLYYMAHDGDNPLKLQLHRVGLDGKGDVRLTDPAFNHSVNIAPDGKNFIDTIQTHDTPPSTRLVNAEGKVLAELAKSDMSRFEQIGLKKVEMFKYKAGDGQTNLYGMLHFPHNFDPAKKYPTIVTVYGGPGWSGASENFTMPSATTEYGFLVASLDGREAKGRGKKTMDAIYEKLGVTEIDDQAAGIKALWDRPYFDKNRVGIYGTSYGGYASIMCLLRHPDVFQAAVASSAVTDWNKYDSIYTERYMWIPQENTTGYKAGSAMTYANNLKGRLMLFFGTADNNVHPSNSLQLIRALQDARKNFEVQVGPDAGHSGINQQRMMEFFIENLVMRPATTTTPGQ